MANPQKDYLDLKNWCYTAYIQESGEMAIDFPHPFTERNYTTNWPNFT